jgi:hypothetical protein
MQLAHAGNDGLAGLFVGAHAERRVFLRELAQRDTHLFLVALGLGFDGDRNHRIGELHPLEYRPALFSAHSVVPVVDVASDPRRLPISPAQSSFSSSRLIGMHLQEASDTLLVATL